jgi:hypothetical protein
MRARSTCADAGAAAEVDLAKISIWRWPIIPDLHRGGAKIRLELAADYLVMAA